MQIIFSGPLGSARSFGVILKTEVLGAWHVLNISLLITNMSRTDSLNRACYVHYIGVFLAAKGSNNSERIHSGVGVFFPFMASSAVISFIS